MITTTQRGNTITETISFTLEECCSCGIPFYIPTYHFKRLKATSELFYCPNGHSQHYSKSEAQKLKEELQKLRDESLKTEQELQNKWLDEMGRANKLQRELKRVHKGVCPCCNRSFQNLRRHIEIKHPELVKKKINP